MSMIDVVLETGEDRRKVVRKAVEALGDVFIDRIKSADTILIKPNLLHHELQLASTHVDAIRAVLDVIRVHSQAKVYVGDASYHGTKAAFRHFGYDRLVADYDDVHLVDLNDDETTECQLDRPNGAVNICRSKLAQDVDLRISLTPMKLHNDLDVSLSVENWTFGTMVVPSRIGATGRVWARWPWLQADGIDAHHRAVADLYEQLPCDVAIVDGVVAMEGEGPVFGRAVPMGVVIAGMDPLAVDAVGSTLMGIDPHDVSYLALCADQNLGILDLSMINVPPMLLTQRRKELDRPVRFGQT